MLNDFDLKKISDLTLSKVAKLDFVNPVIFEKAFIEVAQELGYDDKTIEEIKTGTRLLDASIREFERLGSETTKGLNNLKATTTQASDAIQNEDKEKLAIAQQNVAKLEKELEKLQAVIYKDTLTKSYNRHWLKEVLLEDNCFRNAGVLALIDLNDFKTINDNYGHVTGDKVLVLITSLLHNIIKTLPSAKVIRYGGDEFLIFCTKEPKDLVTKEVFSCREMVMNTPVKSGQHNFKLSFSIGIIDVEKGESFSESLEKADIMMYEDKKNK